MKSQIAKISLAVALLLASITSTEAKTIKHMTAQAHSRHLPKHMSVQARSKAMGQDQWFLTSWISDAASWVESTAEDVVSDVESAVDSVVEGVIEGVEEVYNIASAIYTVYEDVVDWEEAAAETILSDIYNAAVGVW